MATRLKITNEPRAEQGPRSAPGRAVNKSKKSRNRDVVEVK